MVVVLMVVMMDVDRRPRRGLLGAWWGYIGAGACGLGGQCNVPYPWLDGGALMPPMSADRACKAGLGAVCILCLQFLGAAFGGWVCNRTPFQFSSPSLHANLSLAAGGKINIRMLRCLRAHTAG